MFRIFTAFAMAALAAAGSNEAGLKFLEENKNKEGVITLASGMQYKVLTKGSGAFHPTADSSCSCHYHGTLPDGTVFDSSYDRGSPTSFAPNQVIKGWTEAMQMMVEGDVWELYIPSDLAYGDRGSPPKIGGGDTLVFKIEIIEINGDKVPALTCTYPSGETCNEKELSFVEKVKGWAADKVEAQVARLTGMLGAKMSPNSLNWLQRRLHILGQAGTGKEEL